MRTQVFRDRRGEWRWRAVARNGRIIATSGEGYSRKRDALRAFERMLDLIEMEIVEACQNAPSTTTVQ